MRPWRRMLAVAFGLAVAVSARAEQACARVERKAAEVMGLPAGRLDRIVSGKATVCDVWSTDRVAHLSVSLQVKSAGPPGFARMLAEKTRDPDETMRDEPSLGQFAFSLRGKERVSIFAEGRDGPLSLVLVKDTGVGDADVDRARALMKELLGAR
jgi:hypothetical protein